MKQGLQKLFQKFDVALKKELAKARAEGGIRPPPKITCKIVGQVALLLTELPFDISATTDIDIVFDPPHEKNKILEELCLDFGLTLEPDHELIWMSKKLIQNYFRYFPKGKNQIEKLGVRTKWIL